MEFTAEMIASFIGGEVVGNKDAKVWSMGKIEEGKEGEISFLSNPKYEKYVYDSGASIVIVNKSFQPEREVKPTMIKVDNAYECFAKLLDLYVSNLPRKKGISTMASIAEGVELDEESYVGEFTVISEGVKMGKRVSIYPQVYIGDNVTIGDDVTLYPGVKIYSNCVIGNRVIIHSGTVIGADGFGFAPVGDVYKKIPQIGNVILEDDVEIGANTCVDCATMGSTIIHKGVKLDNLVQIAHNVTVGENTVIAAEAGIAGSTHIGRNCMFGGQSATTGHLHIGDRVIVASRGAVMTDIEDNTSWMGAPALPTVRARRAHIIYSKLPELYKTISELEKKVEELSKK